MTYRNMQRTHILYTVFFMTFFCTLALYADDVDVLSSFQDIDTLSIREQVPKIDDIETLDAKNIPHIVVPLTYKLVVGLHGSNWVLDARKSDITRSDKSNVILQELQESQESNIFIFARNSVGTNKFVFSRSDNETADESSYFLSATWVDTAIDTNIEIDALPMTELHDARVLLRDSYATVMIVSENNFDENTTYLFSENTSQNVLREIPKSKSKYTVLPKNNDEVNIPATQENTEIPPRIDISKESLRETQSQKIPTKPLTEAYALLLQKVTKLLKLGNYVEAQNVIENYKNNVNLKNLVPKLLFDSAQYLEKMHENEGIQSIQNIEKAIMFYNRIIDEYSLSVVYDEALARREFLQKKYVFIR